jgi:hypothetical protein
MGVGPRDRRILWTHQVDGARRHTCPGVPPHRQDELSRGQRPGLGTSPQSPIPCVARQRPPRARGRPQVGQRLRRRSGSRGRALWETRVGEGGSMGGVQWGSAADASTSTSRCRISGASCSATRSSPTPIARAAAACSRCASATARACGTRRRCRATPGRAAARQSGAVSAMPGVAFAGRSTGTAALLRLDRRGRMGLRHRAAYETVNGVPARAARSTARPGHRRRDGVRELRYTVDGGARATSSCFRARVNWRGQSTTTIGRLRGPARLARLRGVSG